MNKRKVGIFGGTFERESAPQSTQRDSYALSFSAVSAVKIGLFGGTFDPIHAGHLITAQEVLTKCGLEKVIFVLSADPPHKERRTLAQAGDRLRMVSLAIEGDPRFEVSSMELERPGKSYTVDTLRQMRERFGPDAELCFIIGADNVPEIRTWKEPERIFDLTEVIVATRPGFDPQSMDAPFVERMTFIPTPEIAISSTEIRQRVKEGQPIRYWVPKEVERYIAEKRLYVQPLAKVRKTRGRHPA